MPNDNKTHDGRLMPESVATFKCKSGFIADNGTEMTRDCGVGGHWDDTTQPICMHWARTLLFVFCKL